MLAVEPMACKFPVPVMTFGVGMLASLFEGPGLPPAEEVMVRQPVGSVPHLPSVSRSEPRP